MIWEDSLCGNSFQADPPERTPRTESSPLIMARRCCQRGRQTRGGLRGHASGCESGTPMLLGMTESGTEEPVPQYGAGTPDGFRRLWTPHRMAYIKGEGKPIGPGADQGCPFCHI